MGSIELFLSGEETFTPGPSAPQNPTGAPPAPITLLSHQGLIAKDEEDDDMVVDDDGCRIEPVVLVVKVRLNGAGVIDAAGRISLLKKK